MTDASSGKPLEGATVCQTPRGTDTARTNDLRVIAETSGGVAVLSTPIVASPQPEPGTLVVHLDGYLPASLTEPSMPGTYRVPLHKGRRIEVTVTTMSGHPVAGARALMFTGNFDRGILEESDRSDVCPLAFSTGSVPWYCSAVCDGTGTVVVTAPNTPVKIVAERLGWFPIRGPVEVATASGAAAQTAHIVMEPIQCAILPARTPRILGRALTTTPSGWTSATNIFAFGALDRAKADLERRHSGDLVIAECLLSTHAGDQEHTSMAPQVEITALLDGVGLADLTASLLPFHQVRVTELLGAPSTSALGELSVAEVAGYSQDWDPPLFAMMMETADSKTPVTLDMRFGESYRIPIGVYRVFHRRLGPIGKTHIDDYCVSTDFPCRVTVPDESVRWPVRLTLRNRRGTSPSFCRFVVSRVPTLSTGAEEWGGSPRDPRSYLAFLDEGAYEVRVSCDGSTWTSSMIEVVPRLNEFALICGW